MYVYAAKLEPAEAECAYEIYSHYNAGNAPPATTLASVSQARAYNRFRRFSIASLLERTFHSRASYLFFARLPLRVLRRPRYRICGTLLDRRDNVDNSTSSRNLPAEDAGYTFLDKRYYSRMIYNCPREN